MRSAIEPWWRRFEGWWGEQRRYLDDKRFHGSLRYFDDGHVVVWEGTARAAERQWPLLIRWGPGTPFFPPRFLPIGCRSALHQLKDGSMCLAPPPSLEDGWRGVPDLGSWLDRAVGWFESYARDSWEMEPLLWPFHAARMPGPEYRPLGMPTMLIALPPRWRRGPPGPAGRFHVRVPRSRAGMGAILSFQSIQGKSQRWDAGAALVKGPWEDLHGHWLRLESAGARAARRFIDRETRRGLRENRPLVHATFVPGSPPDGVDDLWSFMTMPDVQDMMATFGLIPPRPNERPGDDHGPWPGVFVDPPALDARRRAGRGDDVSARIDATWVLLAGLGALGSEVAHLLAQEGVRHFVLVDGDLLLPGNVARHRADLSDAGRSKVEAMKLAILRISPSAQVLALPTWIDELPHQLQSSPGTRCLAIGTTGHEGSEHVLGDVCSRLDMPCLHGWLEMAGRVLRLVRVLPGRDPPLLELARRPELLPFVPREASSPAGACAEVILPGSAANLHAAANLVARTALELAAGREEEQNHWLFAPDGINGEHERLDPALRRRFGLAAFVLRVDNEQASPPPQRG